MCSNDSGLWCWDATTQAASDDAPSQRRGWRGVLSFFFEVYVRQGRVTLPCKSLRGVRAPNMYRQAHASRGPETLSSTAFRRSPDCSSLLVVELNSTLASRTVSGCYTVIFEPPLHQLQCLVIGMPAKKPTCLLRRHRDGSLAYSRWHHDSIHIQDAIVTTSR